MSQHCEEESISMNTLYSSDHLLYIGTYSKLSDLKRDHREQLVEDGYSRYIIATNYIKDPHSSHKLITLARKQKHVSCYILLWTLSHTEAVWL
jgi:hypothetical protein